MDGMDGMDGAETKEPAGLDEQQLSELLERQDGVISHRQVRECGGGFHDVRRMLRRGAWTTVHEGVCVNHTGALTWRQRAWAAVLYAGPGSALDGNSALRAEAGPGWRGCREKDPIRVAVDVRRTVKETEDVRIRRVTNLATKVRWSASPPRLLVEEATLDLAAGCPDDHDRFEILARPVRGRSTNVQRLLDALAKRPRVRRRRWLIEVLTDIRAGSCSVLEQGYLNLVERAHGLPAGQRQTAETRDSGRSAYRDVVYPDQDAIVELDGRTHEEPDQRDDDLDRDLETATEQRLTLRLGWTQVFKRGCWTAGRVARILQQRGWEGQPVPCGPSCPLRDASAA